MKDVERCKKQDVPIYFMRVRVAMLPKSKLLKGGGFIVDLDGERTWVNFKYERFCHFCGLLGHDLNHCARHFAAKKHGDEVDYQYGDWLRASSEQQRSLPRNSATNSERRPVSQGLDGTPRVFQGENLGINSDIQQVQSENDGAENIQEGKSIVDEDIDNLNSNYEVPNPKDMQGLNFEDEDIVKFISNSETPRYMQGPIIVEEFAGKLKLITKTSKDM